MKSWWPSEEKLGAELRRVPEATLFDAIEWARLATVLADFADQRRQHDEEWTDSDLAWTFAIQAGLHAAALRAAGVDLDACASPFTCPAPDRKHYRPAPLTAECDNCGWPGAECACEDGPYELIPTRDPDHDPRDCDRMSRVLLAERVDRW